MGSYAEDCLYEVLFSLGAEFYQMLIQTCRLAKALLRLNTYTARNQLKSIKELQI